MRQCEFKKCYDPDMDMYVEKHIYGEGIGDIFKSIGRKLFSRTAKTVAKKAAKTAAKSAATKTGEYAGKKAGDKIVELLSKDKTPQIEKSVASVPLTPSTPSKKAEVKTSIPPTVSKKAEVKTSISSPVSKKVLTQREIDERVNQILSGGKLRRRNFV